MLRHIHEKIRYLRNRRMEPGKEPHAPRDLWVGQD